MARLTRESLVEAAPRTLGDAGDGPLERLGPELRGALDQLVAEAYEAGRRDGYRAGEAEASSRIDALASAVRSALGAAVSELSAVRQADAAATAELAVEIARAVVGREPHDEGRALADRVAEALGSIDDRPLTVRVHAVDVALLSQVLAGETGVEVLADASLEPGEARVVGRWVDADLTRRQAWAVVAHVLA